MKVQSLFTKALWLTLVGIAVMVVTIFRLSPSLAYSTTTPSAQPSVAKETRAYYAAGTSLYKRLGGYNAIAAVIDDALKYILKDPQIGKYFIGLSTNSKERLRQLLVDQFCEATGGPCVYTGRTMKLAHNGIGTGLTNSEFNAFYNDVVKALDENKVPLAEKTEVLTFVNSFRNDIVEK